jgi:hypothetical protein
MTIPFAGEDEIFPVTGMSMNGDASAFTGKAAGGTSSMERHILKRYVPLVRWG